MNGTEFHKPALKRLRHWILCLGLLTGGIGLPWTVAASPTDKEQLENGVFLVASRDLTGSIFEKSVVFVTDYNDRGAIGLIINRPTDIPLARLLPDIHKPAPDTDKLHIGGPVVPQAVFLLIRTDRDHASRNRVIGNISFAAGIDALIHMLANAKASEAVRAYSGYAGWAPGQLEAEVTRGDWLVVHDDPAIIFDADPLEIWGELIKKWSGRWL